MVEYYSSSPGTGSDAIAGIKILVQQIGIGDTKLDTITVAQVEYLQREVDAKINSILDATYEVPLVKVVSTGGSSDFPEEIKYVARRLVASELVLQTYTEIEPNVSKAAVNTRERAMEDLFSLVRGVAGGQRIQGQRIRARNRFIRPPVYPLDPPDSPGKLPSV